MSNKMFMRVEDVAEEMGVSVSYALSNNFAFGCTVFTGQGFIETVLHDIAELVQLRAIVCNRIIITESPHLTIVLV